MKRVFVLAALITILISIGCDTETRNEDTDSLVVSQFQQLVWDEEVTGQLSPFELVQNPSYLPVHEVNFLSNDAQVFITKACGLVLIYPHSHMHVEVVNEEGHGVLMAVTYCPITRSGIAWDRIVGNDTLLLTASGYLLKENLMPLDLNSGSIWSQMRLIGMNGKHNGIKASTLPLIETSWRTARDHFPGAGVFISSSQLKSTEHTDNLQSKGVPIGQAYGIVSWDGIELFAYDTFKEEISIQETTVRPGGRVVVAGSSTYNFMVAFQTDYQMEPVEGEFPVIMKDETGTYWNLFGEAVNGERGGQRLTTPPSYSAADWAWMNLFENVTYFDAESP